MGLVKQTDGKGETGVFAKIHFSSHLAWPITYPLTLLACSPSACAKSRI